jgi:hypothetical protein
VTYHSGGLRSVWRKHTVFTWRTFFPAEVAMLFRGYGSNTSRPSLQMSVGEAAVHCGQPNPATSLHFHLHNPDPDSTFLQSEKLHRTQMRHNSATGGDRKSHPKRKPKPGRGSVLNVHWLSIFLFSVAHSG